LGEELTASYFGFYEPSTVEMEEHVIENHEPAENLAGRLDAPTLGISVAHHAIHLLVGEMVNNPAVVARHFHEMAQLHGPAQEMGGNRSALTGNERIELTPEKIA
jgi:hypothetical protein